VLAHARLVRAPAEAGTPYDLPDFAVDADLPDPITAGYSADGDREVFVSKPSYAASLVAVTRKIG
jgi:hypothetical protein